MMKVLRLKRLGGGGVVFVLLLCACEVRLYRIEGEVVDLNNEPLPGVCISSSQTSDYAITDAKGKFYFTTRKPITKIELIKSDYLPIQIELNQFQNNKINLGKVTLTLKPFIPGVYYFDETLRKYIMLSYSQVKRVKFEEGTFLPSVTLDNVVKISSSTPIFYVYRMPYYDIKLYKMRLREVKVKESSDEKSKDRAEGKDLQFLVPEQPQIVHTRFISTIDNSLFIIEPLKELEAGYYCINWGAFETPFPKILDGYLFEYVPNTND